MKKLQIIGHLGKDSELLPQKENQDFFTIRFSIAHSEKFTDNEGNEQSKTDWVSCFKRYKKHPKNILNILKKGMQVYVDGSPTFGLQTGGNGVYISIALNVATMEFMSKKQDSETRTETKSKNKL